MCLNLKTFVKMVKLLSLAANLGYLPRVQKPGPRPTALAWLWLSKNSGRAKAHPRPKVRPGFWPQAGASTSLTTMVAVSPTSTTTTTTVARSPTSLTTTTTALPGHSRRQQQQQQLLRHPRCRRESVFHLGFTGLVQLRDRLFQLFVGGKLKD